MKFILPVLPISLAAISSFALAREIPLGQCPAAVRTTIQNELSGGVIDEIDLVQKNGQATYIVDIDGPAGRDLTLRINSAGKLLLSSEDIRFSECPPAVRKAVNKLLKQGWKVDDVDRETGPKTVQFRVEIDRRNANDLEVLLDSKGKIVKQKVQPHDAMWPNGVL